MDEITAAYLAGYFERAGFFRIYVKERPAYPGATRKVPGSAGIHLRVRDSDPGALRLLEQTFGGKVRPEGNGYVWMTWNQTAVDVLTAIQPHLRRGKRRALAKLLIGFYEVLKASKLQPRSSIDVALGLPKELMEQIKVYKMALSQLR